VPPDTMKNVAATSGQSVIFAALFFVEVKTWEGICAGRDTVLNFYSRPPKVTLAIKFPQASALFEEYKLCTCMQEKNASKQKYFRQENGWKLEEGVSVLYANLIFSFVGAASGRPSFFATD
jgi:hypothetical protein